MGKLIVVLAMILTLTPSYAQFSSEDGPWYAARVRDIAVGYKNGSSIIYAVNLSGGDCTVRTLIKSTDGGETWSHIQAIQNPYSVATQRNNPDIVLVCALGTGILKSTDGGTNWSLVFPGFIARRIGFQRTDPNIVWAGAFFPFNGFSLYVSGNGGSQWQAEAGFSDQTSITSIAFHPTDPNAIYISGVTRFDPTAKGIWKRVQGGWQKISQGLVNEQIACLSIQESSPQVLYAGTISERGESEPGEFQTNAYVSQPSHVYKTTDGGSTWGIQSAFNAHGIAIDPKNSTNVVAANDAGMFRSTDAGANWLPSTTGLYDSNLLTLVSDTSRGGAILAGGFHSLYKTTNAGLSWIEQTKGIEKSPTTAVRVENGTMLACAGQTQCYPLTDVWVGTIHRKASQNSPWLTTFANSGFDPDYYYWNAIKSHPLAPQTVFAVGSFSPDNQTATVFKSTNDGVTWNVNFQFGAGDAAFKSIDFDATNPAVVFTAGTWNFIPTTAVVAKSLDSGSSWTTLSPGMTDARAIVLDPIQTGVNRVIYVAGSSVKKSSNDGNTWIDASNGIGSAGTLAINPASPNILFGGKTTGVYRTNNSGASWIAVNSGIIHTNTTDVLIHPKTPDVVYASTMEGYAKAHLYKSINSGDSWSEVNAYSVPSNTWVYRLTVDQNDPNRIFVATDSGVYSITHTWTGLITTNTTWKSGQTYLVEGTPTVAAGKTLTIQPNATVQFLANSGLKVQGTLVIEGTLTIPPGIAFTVDPGAQVKFSPNGYLQITGPLKAKGTSASPITFTRNGTTGTWSGLKFIGASIRNDTIEYAKFSYANPALDLQAKNNLKLANTTFDNCNIGVQMIQAAGDMYREIKNCRFNSVTGTGISISNLSNILIDTDTINCSTGAKGIFLDGSSPQILHTRVYDGVPGIECVNFSAPMLEAGINGGYNKVKGTSGAFRCSNGSDAIFGFISGALGDAGGLNSFEIANYAIGTETGASIVLAESCWWGQKTDPGQRLLADDESSIDYVPWKLNNPNPGASILLSNDKGSPAMTPSEDLMREVVQYRSEGQFVQALQTIKAMIASGAVTSPYKKWAVRQLVAIAHRLPGERLSSYIGTLLSTQPGLLRQLRGMHPNILLSEGSVSDAQERFNANIQQYPNSELECAALYGKFLFSLYTANDANAATTLQNLLVSSYAESGEAFMATLQLQNYLHLSDESQLMQLKIVAGGNSAPVTFSLDQNFPNPYNPSTQIKYSLAEDGLVSLAVYDILGREVALLENSVKRAGTYTASFDASKLSSGVYLYRLQSGNYTETRKMVVMK